MQEADFRRCERRNRLHRDRDAARLAPRGEHFPGLADRAPRPLAQLIGTALPATALMAPAGGEVRLNELVLGWGVYYHYPGTQEECHLDALEHRAFARQHPQYVARNTRVVGISSELPRAQISRIKTFGIRYPLLSDPECELLEALGLTSREQPMQAFPRFTIIAHEAVIRQVFHPIYDPRANPAQALAWLQLHA